MPAIAARKMIDPQPTLFQISVLTSRPRNREVSVRNWVRSPPRRTINWLSAPLVLSIPNSTPATSTHERKWGNVYTV